MSTDARETTTTTTTPDVASDRETRAGRFATTRRDVEARQREEFGGFSRSSAFFGWLVAIGIATLLVALLSAAGAAIGITNLNNQDVTSNSATIGIVGGVLLLIVLALAYYAGGYVAGRLARFDGARQGLGVWVLGLVITVILAVAGALFGAKYNVLGQLNLPRIPIKEGTLTTGGAIALIAAVGVTLLASVVGGKLGERFHHRVDRVALDD